jgi:hypothetical protein
VPSSEVYADTVFSLWAEYGSEDGIARLWGMRWALSGSIESVVIDLRSKMNAGGGKMELEFGDAQ